MKSNSLKTADLSAKTHVFNCVQSVRKFLENTLRSVYTVLIIEGSRKICSSKLLIFPAWHGSPYGSRTGISVRSVLKTPRNGGISMYNRHIRHLVTELGNRLSDKEFLKNDRSQPPQHAAALQ